MKSSSFLHLFFIFEVYVVVSIIIFKMSPQTPNRLTAEELRALVYQRDQQEHPDVVRFAAELVRVDVEKDQVQLRAQLDDLLRVA